MLQGMRPEEFDAVYGLLQQSFPPEEYRPYEEQKELLCQPEYQLLVHRKEGKVIAAMAVWRFPECAFLEHFAVAPEYRNCGLGGRMLSRLLAEETGLICLEAELPGNPLTDRRIGFYQRNGFFLNEYPYLQPSLGPGRAPIPLALMTTGGTVELQMFEKIKGILYHRVYKIGKERGITDGE